MNAPAAGDFVVVRTDILRGPEPEGPRVERRN